VVIITTVEIAVIIIYHRNRDRNRRE